MRMLGPAGRPRTHLLPAERVGLSVFPAESLPRGRRRGPRGPAEGGKRPSHHGRHARPGEHEPPRRDASVSVGACASFRTAHRQTARASVSCLHSCRSHLSKASILFFVFHDVIEKVHLYLELWLGDSLL